MLELLATFMPIDGTGWKYSDNMEYKDYFAMVISWLMLLNSTYCLVANNNLNQKVEAMTLVYWKLQDYIHSCDILHELRMIGTFTFMGFKLLVTSSPLKVILIISTKCTPTRLYFCHEYNGYLNLINCLDFKSNLKIGLPPVGKVCYACTLLTNSFRCLYPSQQLHVQS